PYEAAESPGCDAVREIAAALRIEQTEDTTERLRHRGGSEQQRQLQCHEHGNEDDRHHVEEYLAQPRAHEIGAAVDTYLTDETVSIEDREHVAVALNDGEQA